MEHSKWKAGSILTEIGLSFVVSVRLFCRTDTKFCSRHILTHVSTRRHRLLKNFVCNKYSKVVRFLKYCEGLLFHCHIACPRCCRWLSTVLMAEKDKHMQTTPLQRARKGNMGSTSSRWELFQVKKCFKRKSLIITRKKKKACWFGFTFLSD